MNGKKIIFLHFLGDIAAKNAFFLDGSPKDTKFQIVLILLLCVTFWIIKFIHQKEET